MVNIAAMDLRSYLDDQKIPVSQFAADVRVSVAALHRYLAGQRVPRPEIMRRIITASGGAVRPDDFVLATAATEAA